MNIKELALSNEELDHCYEHSHGNTPYTKAKAYGRMVEQAVHAKYAARDAQAVPVAWYDEKLGCFDEKHFDQLQPLYLHPLPQPDLVAEFTEAKEALEEWRAMK